MFSTYKGNTKHFFGILIPKQCTKNYSSSSANHIYFVGPQGVARRCSVKHVFLKVFQNSQDKTCVGVSFLRKLQASSLQLCSKVDSNTGVLILTYGTSKLGLFTKLVCNLKSLTILIRSSILRSITGCWICVEYFFRFAFYLQFFYWSLPLTIMN